MLSIDIRNIVYTLVRQLLIEPGGRKDEALQFSFDCGLAYYGHVGDGDEIYDARRGLYLLYYLPPERSYVTVFSAVTRSPFVKPTEWKHECTHDTCWRDINIFSEIYFDMANKINAAMVKDGYGEVAPIMMTDHNSFQAFGKAWEWVGAKVVTDPACDRSYRKLVTLETSTDTEIAKLDKCLQVLDDAESFLQQHEMGTKP